MSEGREVRKIVSEEKRQPEGEKTAENKGKKAIPKETEAQKMAFDLYFSMGTKRSLEAVAAGVGKSTRTIGEWSRKFHWKDRLVSREIEEAAEKGSDSNTVIDAKAEYRQIIRALMATFVQDYKAGKVKIKTMADFERIVKLDLLLLGDYTERIEAESKQSVELTEEDRRAIFAVADSIKAEMDALKD